MRMAVLYFSLRFQKIAKMVNCLYIPVALSIIVMRIGKGATAMANQNHFYILKQGIGFWNRWRQDNPTIQPDLSKARLDAMNLSSANFSRADLSFVNFTGTNLSGAIFKDAKLTIATLSSAILINADLSNADLTGADLTHADLKGANLSNA